MATIHHTHQVYTPKDAEYRAFLLQKGEEDGWTYKAMVNPNPKGPFTAVIAVYDETGEFVGYF